MTAKFNWFLVSVMDSPNSTLVCWHVGNGTLPFKSQYHRDGTKKRSDTGSIRKRRIGPQCVPNYDSMSAKEGEGKQCGIRSNEQHIKLIGWYILWQHHHLWTAEEQSSIAIRRERFSPLWWDITTFMKCLWARPEWICSSKFAACGWSWPLPFWQRESVGRRFSPSGTIITWKSKAPLVALRG